MTAKGLAASLIALCLTRAVRAHANCECMVYPWPPACSGVCAADAYNKASARDLVDGLKLSPKAAETIIGAKEKKQFSTTGDIRRAVLGGASKRDLTKLFKLSPSVAEAIIKRRGTKGADGAAVEDVIGKDRLYKFDGEIVTLAEELTGLESDIVIGPNARVEQHSEGPNSPNIIGSDNQITINEGSNSGETSATLTYTAKGLRGGTGAVFSAEATIYTDAPISRPAFMLFCDQPIISMMISNSAGSTLTGDVTGPGLYTARGQADELHKFVRLFGVGFPDPVRPRDDIVIDIKTKKPLKCILVFELTNGPPRVVALQRTPGSSLDACSEYMLPRVAGGPIRLFLPKESK